MYKLLSWMAVILWMSLIFCLSHQPAAESSELSSSVTEVIINTIETIAPKVKIEKGDLHHIVRKNAHFFTI
jgi:VanZ family protein